ncbi:MAG: hypothetical protein COA58_14315 [Bacteroidetes bacterium]|nr:MAG: hypothetical protein COA58_14315 [Bacteroidota bacterium]
MKILFLFFLLLGSIFSFSQSTETVTVYFESNSYKISNDEYLKLATYFLDSGTENISKIHLAGHTDNSANSNYNKTLSQNRCKAVQEMLTSKLNIHRPVLFAAYGEMQPLNSNKSDQQKQQNRRVIISITRELKTEKMDEENPAPSSESFYYDGWQKEAQKFTINPKKSNVLKGNEGTIIILPPDAICDMYSGFNADIYLKEYYTREDMIMGQLTTSSDGRMLESAGMIELIAMKDGKELKLCKKVSILFPSANYENPDFIGFKGTWDDPHNTINWETIEGGNANFSGKTAFPECLDKKHQVIRVDWNSRKKELKSLGRSRLRQRLRNDEVIKKLRHRFWFRKKVTTKLYNQVYEGMRYRMKDTMSASAYTNCREKQRKAKELLLFLNNLKEETGFDPQILNAETGYIVSQVSEFGNINCDRFTSYPSKRDFNFNVGKTEGVISSRLIFHSIKSIMPGIQRNKHEASFDNIPVGELATLLVIKYVKDKILVAHDKIELGETPNLQFEEVKKSKLPDMIKSITDKIK